MKYDAGNPVWATEPWVLRLIRWQNTTQRFIIQWDRILQPGIWACTYLAALCFTLHCATFFYQSPLRCRPHPALNQWWTHCRVLPAHWMSQWDSWGTFYIALQWVKLIIRLIPANITIICWSHLFLALLPTTSNYFPHATTTMLITVILVYLIMTTISRRKWWHSRGRTHAEENDSSQCKMYWEPEHGQELLSTTTPKFFNN